jgi:hypothetical protein
MSDLGLSLFLCSSVSVCAKCLAKVYAVGNTDSIVLVFHVVKRNEAGSNFEKPKSIL